MSNFFTKHRPREFSGVLGQEKAGNGASVADAVGEARLYLGLDF